VTLRPGWFGQLHPSRPSSSCCSRLHSRSLPLRLTVVILDERLERQEGDARCESSRLTMTTTTMIIIIPSMLGRTRGRMLPLALHARPSSALAPTIAALPRTPLLRPVSTSPAVEAGAGLPHLLLLRVPSRSPQRCTSLGGHLFGPVTSRLPPDPDWQTLTTYDIHQSRGSEYPSVE